MTADVTSMGMAVIPATALIAVLLRPRWLVAWTAVLAPLEAASVANFYVNEYGVGLQPGYLAAAGLVVIVVLKLVYRGTVVRWRALIWLYTPLLLFTMYALVTAALLPFLLAGHIDVFPPRAGIALSSLTPLRPSATNLSQAIYLVFLVTFAFSVSVVANQATSARAVATWYIGSGVLVCLVGFYQLAAFYAQLPYPTRFLYSNPVYYQGYNQLLGDVKRISSTLTEPSAMAYYLVGVLGALLGRYFFEPARFATAVLFAVVLVVLLMSTSTTAYLSLVALMGTTLLIVLRTKVRFAQSMLRLALVLGALGFLAVAAWASRPKGVPLIIFESAILEKMSSESFANRLGSDMHSLSMLVPTFGLGVGWGSNRPSSLLTSVLSTVGIPGFVLLIWFGARLTRTGLRTARKDKGKVAVVAQLGLSLIAMIEAGVLSKPDLTHIPLWLNLGALAGVCVRPAIRAHQHGRVALKSDLYTPQ